MIHRYLPLLFAVISIAGVADAQDDAEIKRIQADYETIEKSFRDWPSFDYHAVGLPGGQGLTYHVARSEEEPALMRVQVHVDDDHGPLDETFCFKGDKLEFVFRRSEFVAMRENAPTEVVENRYYFVNETLVRALQKKATFRSGKEPVMDSVKSKVLELDKIEDAASLYEQFSSKGQEAYSRLNMVALGQDAPANSGGGHRAGDGWRLIQGTESPPYQELGIGWHVKGDPELEKDDDGAMSYFPETDGKVENVVVDLNSGAIIGKTHGTHSSDKAHFSQTEMTNEAVWSGSREFMVQMAQAKHFDTMFAELYYLPEMQSVSPGTDVLKAVKSAVVTKMSGKVKAEDVTLGLHDVLVARRGSATILSVGATLMSSDGEGPDFTVTFKVTPNGKDGAPMLKFQDLVSDK